MGYAYRLLKKYDESLANYNKAIQLRPQENIFRRYRAEFYMEFGKYKEAFADYDSIIENFPHFTSYCLRANAYMSIGKYKEALKDYEQRAVLAKKVPMKKVFCDECDEKVKEVEKIIRGLVPVSKSHSSSNLSKIVKGLGASMLFGSVLDFSIRRPKLFSKKNRRSVIGFFLGGVTFISGYFLSKEEKPRLGQLK